MKDQVCTQEQMQTLIDKGVNVSKASMRYERTGSYNNDSVWTWDSWELRKGYNTDLTDCRGRRCSPTFTVADLMNLFTNEGNPDVRITAGMLITNDWYVRVFFNGKSRIGFTGTKLIDPVYECIEWLLDNGHKLNNQ